MCGGGGGLAVRLSFFTLAAIGRQALFPGEPDDLPWRSVTFRWTTCARVVEQKVGCAADLPAGPAGTHVGLPLDRLRAGGRTEGQTSDPGGSPEGRLRG